MAKANKAAHARYEIDSAIAKANYDALVAAEPGLKGTPHQPLVQRAFTPEPIPTFVQYNSQAQDRMLDTGFTLTYSYCSDFFLSQGKSQTVLLTLRDAIATAGTLATGALALADFQNPATQSTVLAVVGLGTAGATAGIDIYTQRFIFG